MGALRFTGLERGEQAGRPTLRAVGRPRGTDRHDWSLGRLGAMGADELVLDVDAERGTLLRIESRHAGEPYSVREVLEIAFGEDFAEETFELQRPEGEPVRSARDRFKVHHDIPIDRAVALAPFPVWIVRRVPADWEVDIAFAEGDDDAPQLFLHYRGGARHPGARGRRDAAGCAARGGAARRRAVAGRAAQRPRARAAGAGRGLAPRAGPALSRGHGHPAAFRNAERGCARRRGSRARPRAGERAPAQRLIAAAP